MRNESTAIRCFSPTEGSAKRKGSCEKLSEIETIYNLEVAEFHTYYVSDACVLVHNACKSDWEKERRSYWKKQANVYNGNVKGQLSASGKYHVTQDDIIRLSKGKAPIGTDGKSVNLHYVLGKSKNMYNYIELTHTEHFMNFRKLHYWLYS